jgi:hypothetical protein
MAPGRARAEQKEWQWRRWIAQTDGGKKVKGRKRHILVDSLFSHRRGGDN